MSKSANRGDETGTSYMPPDGWRKDAFLETYKSQISLLIEGLKLLGLANGAAAIALLTYLGSPVKTVAGPVNFVPSMTSFVWGLTACIVGFFACYFCQMCYLKLLSNKDGARLFDHLFFFVVSVLAIVASIWFFKEGAGGAAALFSSAK